jgi:hypothetical protein
MSRGLGAHQAKFLAAVESLAEAHGAQRWVYCHAVIRKALGAPPPDTRLLRPSGSTEAQVNPTRIFAALARRGLIERNAKRGPGASVRLSQSRASDSHEQA